MHSNEKRHVFLSALLALAFSGGAMAEHNLTCHLPEGPLVLYEDLISQGWNTEWSWGGNMTPWITQSSPGGQEGAYAIRAVVAAPTGGGLEIHTDGGEDRSTAGRSALAFKIRKEMSANMSVWTRGAEPLGVESTPFPLLANGAPLGNGQWHSFVIPLSDLQSVNKVLGGVIFHTDAPGTMYVDEVMFTVPIVLKWPLSTSYAGRQVNHAFGVDWAGGTECPAGVIKKHDGTDYQAAAGTAVYAPESGAVKEVLPYNATWAQNVVIEHTAPSGLKYTTVSWHVDSLVSVNQQVTKGTTQIGTIANIGSATHFHFGVRMGAYLANVSGTGALPQNDCDGYPAFPAGFVNPENVASVLFQ